MPGVRRSLRKLPRSAAPPRELYLKLRGARVVTLECALTDGRPALTVSYPRGIVNHQKKPPF